MDTRTPLLVEILLFDGFDELDAFAPWEVFAGLAGATGLVETRLVTHEGARAVPADHGAVVTAHGPLSARPDVLVVPGGGWLDRTGTGGVAGLVADGTVPAALAARHAAGTVLASVCTGAFLLAASGVLDGRRATTNPRALDDLRRHDGIEVVAARVVDDGVVTAGAPACGLDLAVHLTRRFLGSAVADAVCRELQLEPAPALSA